MITLYFSTYIVMFPKTIRPNIDTDINVQILESTGPVNVEVALVDETDRVISSNQATIVQVNFRVMGMNPDLSLVKEPFDIDIFDPKGNKIAQFKNAQDPSGVYTDYMTMSDHPVLGDWKIKVKQGNEKYEKTFTVDEYVLPKFEVSIIFGKPFHLSSDGAYKGKIKAMYTFGKPVKGRGRMRIRRPWRSGKVIERDFKVKVSDRDDQPLANPFSRVNVKVTYQVAIEPEPKPEPKRTTPLPLNIGEPLIERRIIPDIIIDPWFPPRRRTKSVEKKLPPLDVPTDGIVMFDLDILPNTTDINIEAKYEKQSDYKSLVPFKSPSNSFLQVKLLGDSPKAGDIAQFEIKSTEPVPNVHYQLLAKGQIVQTGSVPMDQPDMNSTTFSFPITYEMTPKTRLNVYYIRPDGEVITDVITFNVDGVFKNKVSINFDRRQVQPGKEVILTLKADPDSLVNVLAVDKSVLLLKSGNDLSKDEISSELDKYDNLPGGGGGGPFPIFWGWRWPRPSSGEDAEDVFRNSGIAVLTDANVYNYVEPFRPRPMPMRRFRGGMMADFGGPRMMFAMAAPAPVMAMNVKSAPPPAAPSKPKPVQKVRKLFPETWLWTNSTVGMALDLKKNIEYRLILKTKCLIFIETFVNENGMVDCPEDYNMVQYSGRMASAGMVMMDSAPMLSGAVMRKSPMKLGSSGPKKQVKVRKEFPETWLWMNSTIRYTGDTTMSVKVPDTITKWVATAFAVNNKTGLGLSPSPANVEVFMPFFISLQLPYSVIRGEEVIIQANIFNYLPYEAEVLIILEKNEGWNNTVTLFKDSNIVREKFKARIGRKFKIPAGGVAPAYFPVEPLVTGDLKVNMSAWTSTGISDGVIKYLKVEPEGTENEFNQPVLISLGTPQNPENGGLFREDVDISFPPNTVKGSRRIRASVFGDIMGPSINGIENLLKMPYGCGEQNMLNFAPNIFVQKYLAATNKLTPDLESKIKDYTIKGYQREMTYQHSNTGGFSAFGDSDKSATTWLTSFVIKSFAQASRFITIDDDSVLRAVQFVIDQQNPDGSFREPGRVLHKEMQGGSAAGERSLTAFVLIALKEATVFNGVQEVAQRAIDKATMYLEGQITPAQNNLYELALLGYALEMVKSPKVDDILSILQSKAQTEGGMKYWKKPVTAEKKWKSWAPVKDRPKAVDVETTAYVLLIYALKGDKVNAIPIMRWIAAQRNPEGGFVSTQDTVVALQSLAEIASYLYSKTFNMRVRFDNVGTGTPFTKEFRITQDNALVFQFEEVPHDVQRLRISAEGSGIALAEVATFFNIEDDLQSAAFDANVTLEGETMNGFTVKVCTRWLKEGNAAMSIMDIGIPSGMQPDLDSLDTSMAPYYKRKEMGSRKLTIYLDEINALPQCVSVYMQTTDMVGEKQPSVIRIFDYYEPDNQVTTFYQSAKLASAGVCDVCGRECFCPDLEVGIAFTSSLYHFLVIICMTAIKLGFKKT
ncbi:hypothetical protein FSP39_013711 [Pinctada imbricata]|uniref:CD109 antigen n=1 Tax=Pinctada imbricata TaxID=66713 RepID=A0AA88Y8H2_PINIB|nr:hypothetical protein FSP39_013711 [Pinctada imbricata]